MKQKHWTGKKLWNTVASLPGHLLAKFITQEISGYQTFSVHDADTLADVIKPCDVLLVEGNQWVSGAIKYLTQSTWSHSAMYVGNIIDPETSPTHPKVLIEADIRLGVVAVPLSSYSDFNTRICRPVGLSSDDKAKIISFMMKHLGMSYDLKNVLDLARYLFPTPPIPRRFRRRMIALGSGDPTQAICSSLIAQAFHSVGYPILPDKVSSQNELETLYEIRHHSLFAPRDFDLSPYFKVIKPTLVSASHFDHRTFTWRTPEERSS
ncbi:MAG TPA: lipo-like protein [Gammaproteobacteria bacterium]|nr:lipo-like protein [Gammaproteobacteria bacterium]